MTALKEYQRLEATGLWRPDPGTDPREVLVSIGEATLTISDFSGTALTHWSLAAFERADTPGWPATYHPEGDPGETLCLPENEPDMVEALDRVRRAVALARPGRRNMRALGILAALTVALGLLALWAPDAILRHTLSVVPEIKRQDIGAALMDRVERITGPVCRTTGGQAALEQLGRRLGVRQLAVVPGGVRQTLLLPGGVMLVNRSLVEAYEDPAVLAGFILAEKARAEARNPLKALLEETGPLSSARLLTTGALPSETLDLYAEQLISTPREPVSPQTLLPRFAAAGVPSKPYAFARDASGESVVELIEADPTKGAEPNPVLRDRDWLLLQGICGT